MSVIEQFDDPCEKCPICGLDLKLHWRGQACLAPAKPCRACGGQGYLIIEADGDDGTVYEEIQRCYGCLKFATDEAAKAGADGAAK